jgi:hypothetical protein
VAAGPGSLNIPRADALSHGHRFTGEQGFIDTQIDAPHDLGVGGHAVPLRQKQYVAPDNVTPGDPFPFSIADDRGPRARKIPQGFKRPLGLALLVDRYTHDDKDETEEHQRIGEASEEKIDTAGTDEEKEHGLARHVPGDGKEAPSF